ncbi:DUF3566 domain-containing protein [Modestobacter sp. L9-4]|uniref:DUF3566 domain-containing protein n=1 Tax=Modestobacter sp. L9-4 TaxID=2851567 RepID=UPI001F3BED5B|nr:DUF3566 domain-containing protein [Modestobacter sp. L9-4]
MSDRARSSVRTDSREGSATADVEPAGATRASDVPAPAPAATGPDAAKAEAPASSAPVGSTARPLAGQPAPGEGTADEPRAVSTPGPPVPPAGAGNRISAGVRSASARAAAPMDATQSVTLPPAGAPARPSDDARPVDPPRGPAPRSADTGRPTTKGRRGPRRARLQLRHIDTWSALKISLVVSIALFFVWMIAVAVLYGVLSGLGVFDSINDLIGQVSTSTGGAAADSFTITAGLVFTGAAVIGAVNILLLTALCTVGTFVYNLCSDLVGGLELTLAERE